ncbi:MAG: hypothetical protein LBQ12_04975 [Deltaproteobacteria bacterium]|nr:hypothetical protein [Deltaproteobacteria bacterium]
MFSKEDRETTQFEISEDGKFGTVRAFKLFFERDCVLTVAGRRSSRYWVSARPSGEKQIELSFSAKDGTTVNETFLMDVLNDLVDTQIRLDLEKEFGGLRQTIVDYAFLQVGGKDV